MASSADSQTNSSNMALRAHFRKIIQATRVTSSLVGDTPLIGTHNGKFHCDEVVAVAMLKMLPKFASHTVVRTRDPEILNKCEVVVDVGAVYDAHRNRFDHHQREFTQTMSSSYDIKLSSAGLVYKHFGKDILQEISAVKMSSDELEKVYWKCYSSYMLHIDAEDNGVEPSEGPRKYSVTSSLPARVARMNPRWNEDTSDETANKLFKLAVEQAALEVMDVVDDLVFSWLPARVITEKAIDERHKVDPSGAVVLLPQYCPWSSHVHSLEKEKNIQGSLLYFVYPDTSGSWRVQCVPEEGRGFVTRLSLPTAWCGLRDDKLVQACGIEESFFAHANGFIGGNRTMEGALEMAKQSMSLQGK